MPQNLFKVLTEYDAEVRGFQALPLAWLTYNVHVGTVYALHVAGADMMFPRFGIHYGR